MSAHPDSTPHAVCPEQTAPGRARRGWVLVAVAIVASVAAVVLLAMGLRAGHDSVVLDADDVVIDSAPVTVAPIVTAPPTPAATSTRDVALDASGEPLSPLVELLGPRYSAVPEEVSPRPQPVNIEIDSIDVARFPIRGIGLQDDGQLEIPDETEIGWYRYGSTPGREGATVLAAHVSWNRSRGPFARLGSVEPGNQITVRLDDGSARQYVVTERTLYGKLELPKERIWRNTGDEALVLITCGGDFNPDIRRFNENIVVYAVPVG
jgi:sortase (surface protein transpeptidase)